jgi:hypothetical protein
MRISTLILSITTIFLITGCSNINQPSYEKNLDEATIETSIYEKPTATKEILFNKKLQEVALLIPQDPLYDKINLDTPEKKEWFKMLTYRLWDRQITRYQYLSEGLEKYPSNKYEFEFIVKALQK